MASRSSSRQTRHAFDPQRNLDGEVRGHSGWAEDHADQDDGQPVNRILSSLDRLGERIRALSATRDGADDRPAYRADPREDARSHRVPPPPPRRAAVREPSSAGIELQRAIEQIARKRDALDRGIDRSGRDAEPAARPRPPADRRDVETIDDVRGELRDLRRSVDRLGAEDHGRTLRGLGDRIDALARSSVDPRLVSALRDDVETLRDTVLSSVSTAPLKALEANYDDIVRRLEHMRGAIDNPRTVADLIQRLGDIRRLIGQVPTESHILAVTDRLDALAQRLDAAPDGRALADMERQLASLATAVAGLDQSRAVETVENALSEVYAQLATIEKRLGGLDSIERWQENLDRQAALLSQLAQRTDQLPRVAHEMERQSASVDGLVRSVEALPRLASDLAAVRRTLDGEASQASRGYEQLVGRIDELAARLERTSPSADVLADPALGDRLAEIASRLDRLDVRPGSADVAVLESHFARLAASLESRLSGAAVAPAAAASADPAALPAGLMDALARIESHLASTTPYDRFAELESRVIDLTEALGSFERLAPPDVAGIERAITALRDEVSALAAPTTAGIEHELRTLAERFDSFTAPATLDADALERLEARLSDVVDRLDGRPGDATLLADALARFERTLADALDPDRIADSAVRAAAAALSDRGDDGTRDALIQVQRDLGTLQEDLRTAARRDRELLSAIGEAVERLAEREVEAVRPDRVADAPRPEPTAERDSAGRLGETDSATWKEIERTLSEGLGTRQRRQPEPPSPEDDIALPRIFGRRDEPEATVPAGRVEPVVAVADLPDAAPDFDVNKPLEPGSGKPQRVAPARAAAPQGRGADTGAPAARTGEPSKADFIAAARRAAQAAGSEPPAGGRRAPVVAAEDKPAGAVPAKGRFALRLPPFVKTHRRQLAIAAVALLVAVGSVRIVANFLTTPEPTVAEAPIPAESETAEVPAPAADAPPADVAEAPAAGPSPSPEAALPPAAASDPGAAASMPPGPTTAFGSAPETPPVGKFEPAGAPAPDDAAAANAETGATPPAGAPAALPETPAVVALPPESVGPLALRQAAAGGNPAAQFEVAARLTEGRGVPQNLPEAALWYERAAANGLAPAQYRLGSLYEKGQGVARDPKKAADWYERAAAAGNTKSMHNLAVLHAEGGLGQPNYETAASWFEKAADYGVRDSQYNLGILYARGLGVPRDLTASYKWFAIAAQAGDADSAKKRDDVAQVLDKDALARARLAVETWKQKPADPAANEVAADDPAWTATPEQTAATVSTGNLIAEAQALLARRGYDPGPADGKMGKRTRDAIAAFQKARGLPETGDVDVTLIQALSEQAI